MPTDSPVAEIEKTAENVAGKFLADLVAHGEKLVAADLPYDVRKVLGALIHWTGNGGSFVEPDVFNPALSAEVAQREASESRLASENADLNKRLAALETLFQQGQVQPSPVPVATPSEGAVPPTAPASAPTPTVPVVTAPPEAAQAPAPVPPVSE